MESLVQENIQQIPGRIDSDIQHMVTEELEWDRNVPAANVGVMVDQGVVTLTGHVNTLIEKLAAQKAAHRIEGVLDVANDIVVKYGEEPVADDTRIAHAVRSALEADSRIPSESIQTTVNAGHVLLQGTVPHLLTRYWAGLALQHVAGIRSVTNAITIDSPKPFPESQENTVQKIENALLRQLSQHARHIQVTMKDGIVTLSGAVRSSAEREAAFESALHAPGVHEVVNHLRIAPYL